MTSLTTHRATRARSSYLAVLLVTCSGLLMLAAGQTLATAGWAAARPFAIGGGLTVQTALFIERRVRRHHPARHRPGSRLHGRLITSALVSMSGAGLVFIGHLAAAHGWWPTGVAILPCILGVAAAARFNDHVTTPTPALAVIQRPPLGHQLSEADGPPGGPRT